ncbi:MAG TPA: hypothetical protein VG099_03205, partial [Gemmataceae bacterium]|nr:hypothetical protein [Gemmataceae bacterium]
MSGTWRNWWQGLNFLKGRSRKNRRPFRRLGAQLLLEPLETRTLLSGPSGPGWTGLNNTPNTNGIQNMLLLPDGTVMALGNAQSNNSKDSATSAWFQLQPDNKGNYVNGQWSQLPDMSLPRLFFTADVLANGDVFVLGGEYSGSNSQQNWTNTGETFETFGHTWNAIPNFPEAQYGDVPSEALPGGKILAGSLVDNSTWTFDLSTRQWSAKPVANKLRNDRSDEETWVKLPPTATEPQGSILSYDCYSGQSFATTFHAQRYIIDQNTWVDASNLDMNNPPGLLNNSIAETGPGFLLPDGRAFFLGATGQTAFYTPSTNTWSAGPPIPFGLNAGDESGAMMPNGHVLFVASGGSGTGGGASKIFEFDPIANTYADVTPQNVDFSTPSPYMLTLPNGQIAVSTVTSNQLLLYTPSPYRNLAWSGNILDITQNGGMENGAATATYSGTRLNGISEGANLGDDAEMASNYPLVFAYDTNSFGQYLPTLNWNSTGVAEGNRVESVDSEIDTLNNGQVLPLTYLVQTVANGIASLPVLNIEMSPALAGGTNVTLRLDPNDPTQLQVLGCTLQTGDVPLSDFTRIIVTGSFGNDNSLTVDYATDGFFSTPVVFEGGSGGTNTLTVTDAGDSLPRRWVVNSYSVTDLDINTEPTVFYRDAQLVTLFNSNGGGMIRVDSTSATTNLVSDGATDVNVGNGDCHRIMGILNIENPAGSNTVTVDDSAEFSAPAITLGTMMGGNPNDSQSNSDPWGQISGLAPGNINYEYGDTSSLILKTGAGTGIVVNVQATCTLTTIISYLSTTVNVGNIFGTVGDIAGTLTLQGSNTVTIDDVGDKTARTATLSTGQLSGLAPATINYDAASLTVNTTDEVDGTVVNVLSMASYNTT